MRLIFGKEEWYRWQKIYRSVRAILDGTVQLTNEKWKCSNGKIDIRVLWTQWTSLKGQELLPAAVRVAADLTRSKLPISHLRTKAAILARHYIGRVDRLSYYKS